MEDRDDGLWDGLGVIDSIIDTPATSPPVSPTNTPPGSPWLWNRTPLPRMVRLHDGEPAEDAQTPPDLDLLLSPFPVASGRVEKHLPLPTHVPPADLVPSQPKKENNLSKTHPVLTSNDPIKQPRSKALPVKAAVQRAAREQGNTLIAIPQPHRTFQPPLPTVPTQSTTPPLPPVAPLRTTPQVHRKPFAPRGPTQPTADVPTGSLKEKREREAKQFPKEILGNLDGTTSAEVRKMNATERELVLYKRKLRNRESARRSRQKRQATLAELQEEIDDLMQVTTRMVEVGISLHEENVKLRQRLNVANAEMKGMRSMYTEPRGTGPATASASSAALKMKLGG